MTSRSTQEWRHTPGPWTVEDPFGPDILSIVESGKPTYDWRMIATIAVDDEEFAPLEAEANARLIAAAPELLEALQYVLSAHGEQLHDAFDQAHKAIAKALPNPPSVEEGQ